MCQTTSARELSETRRGDLRRLPSGEARFENERSRPLLKIQISTIFAARMFRLVAGLAVTVLTARFLGPAGQGEYYFVLTVAAAIAQFGNLGLHASNTYLVARNNTLLAPLVSNSVWIAFFVGGGLAALVIGSSYFFETAGSSPGNVWFAVVLAPLALLLLLGQNLLLGLGKAVVFSAIEVLSSGLVLTFQVVAALFTPTSGGFLFARTAGLVVSSGAVLFLLIRRAKYRLRFDMTTFRLGFAYSAKAYFVALLGFLVLRANVFLLQKYAGFDDLGLYSVASQVADALEIIPTSVALVLFPTLLRTELGGWRVMRRTLLAVAGVMAVICVSVAVLSEPLIELGFGSKFGGSATILKLLLPEVFFIALTTIASQYLAAIGMPLALLGIWIVGVIAVLAAGSILIPMYGGNGAAAALSLTYALIFFLVFGLAAHGRGSE